MKQLILVLLLLGMSSKAIAGNEYTVKQAELELPESWFFGEVVGIAENKHGHKFVFNRGQHQLIEFDQHGKFVKEIGHGQFVNPNGLRIDRQGNIWTVDGGTHLVQRFSAIGEVTMVLGMKGKASEGWFDRDYNMVLFNNPEDVGFDKSDNIFVVDRGNHRIVKLDANGLFLKAWGQKGSGEGQFNFAHSVVVDNDDRVLVADRENKRIQLFNLEGKFLEQWPNIGYPYVLALFKDTIWFTDARFERVTQLDSDGRLLLTIQGEKGRNLGQFGFVHGLHVSADNKLFVTQILNWSVLELTLSH